MKIFIQSRRKFVFILRVLKIFGNLEQISNPEWHKLKLQKFTLKENLVGKFKVLYFFVPGCLKKKHFILLLNSREEFNCSNESFFASRKVQSSRSVDV